MSDQPTTLVALLHGPDQKGLVARVSGWIFARGGNILHADQHRDAEEGIFFQRIEWTPEGGDYEAETRQFLTFAAGLGMSVRLARSSDRPRLAIFVSKAEHCLLDLLMRWKTGELPCQIAVIVANHEDLRPIADSYGIPFHLTPAGPDRRAAAEDRQLAIVHRERIELVVLARYMQILTPDFINRLGCPAINIHHSFLPAFAGAKPYHQAHHRGVKIIGATAHYVTAVLDEGPIIQQAVAPVNHRHNVSDLVRKGRDLERTVLAQAVRWHLANRVLAYSNKTVVFD